MSKLHTILVVEDDKIVRQMLRNSLETESFIVLEASKGQRSVEILQQHSVDTVLLDLSLPDAKGLEYISAIRACTNAPLIIVSGEEEEVKKIDSLEKGADDFVEKPVDFNMLNAKIKAHIRRYQSAQPGQPLLNGNGHAEPALSFHNWVVDKEKYQLFDGDGQSANLTMKEYMILIALLNNAGKTLSRHELCTTIQEQNYIPSDRAIDVKITRIRRKLGDDAVNPDTIKTIRGAGYLFNADIINRLE